ncbi:unnamed protein product [Orchesella dallaii]|uniref:Uncharacterized protein n=1 Tax=Orchesella dallaii TaxID=48710 RepID=A0ABP1R403_9HEXA
MKKPTLVKFPTYFNNSTNQSARLDSIYSNVSKLYSDPCELPLIKDCIQFHIAIELQPKKQYIRNNVRSMTQSHRDYGIKNLTDFGELVDNINWAPVYKSDNIDF